MLWSLAVAARDTEGLVRAEHAAGEAQGPLVPTALGERPAALDQKFSEELDCLLEPTEPPSESKLTPSSGSQTL